MNAPEPAVAAPADAMVVARAPLDHFAPSLTNGDRHAGNKAYLEELAVTIKDHGVIQPITARPWPAARGKAPAGVLYEIVVGEGRWLASKLAGKADIPFFWRELTDEEALELQLIENLKRKDLTAIQEAEGYRRLMKEHGHNVDTIAAAIQKSRSHVYAQLKLLDLGAKARAALLKGDLDPSRALLIARIPTEALQDQALVEILKPRFGNEPLSYRRAAEHIQEHYMLRLAEAPFPRGDCAGCPKRTGNQADLFADVKSADVCTDPACFTAKKEAHLAAVLAKAEARGQKVLTGKEAKKVKPNHYSDVQGDYLALDDHCFAAGAKGKTYRQLLGKNAPAPTLLVDPHQPDKLIEILPKTTLKEHLEAKGIKLDARPSNPVNAEAKKREQKAKVENAWRGRVFDAIRSHLTQDFAAVHHGPNLDDLEQRWVATTFFGHLGFDAQKRLARLWIGPTDKKQDDHALIADFRKRLPELPAADHGRLLIEMALVGDTFANTWHADRKPERLLEAAQAYDIDAEAIKKAVVAEFKAKEKPKTAPKPKKPAAKASPPTAAAQAKGKAATPAGKGKKPAKAAPVAEKKPTPKKPKAKADPAPASPAERTAPAAPGEAAAAESTERQITVGSRVRVKADAKGPNGIKRKCCGREGAVEEIGDTITVRFGKKAHELVTNLHADELEILPPPAIAMQAWPFPTGSRLA